MRRMRRSASIKIPSSSKPSSPLAYSRPACASAISPNALDAHPYQICMKTGPRKISDRSGMFHGLCVCAWSSVDDVDWESLLADLRCAGCFRWEISVPQNGPFALGGMLCLPGP